MIRRPWTGTSGPHSFLRWVAWGDCLAFRVLDGGHANATNRSVRRHPGPNNHPLPRWGAHGLTGRERSAPGEARTLPIGPRLGAEPELCCAGCPTSWLTEGSLLSPPP